MRLIISEQHIREHIEDHLPRPPAAVRAEVDRLMHLRTRHMCHEVMRLAECPHPDRDLLAPAAVRLWLRMAPSPIGPSVPLERWRALWAVTGYTVDGEPAERPSTSRLLYRGSRRPYGVCWTEDPASALAFATAHGFVERSAAEVDLWATEMPPEALWARMPLGMAGRRVVCDEWVVDPDLIGPVRRWTTEELAATPRARVLA